MSYATEQRRILTDFLEKNADTPLSVRNIAEGVKGKKISISALYRNLKHLEQSGLVEKSLKEGSREVLYRFVGCDCCKDRLHLTCVECGKVFHMEDKVADAFLDNLSKEEGFSVSRNKTVIYGVCRQCGKENKILD